MAKKAKKAKTNTRKSSAAKATRKTAAKRAAARRARPKSVKSDTPHLRTAVPSFTVNDLARSLAWYCDVLGCVVKDRWEYEGTLRGAELGAGDVVFMIGQDDWQKGRDRVKGEGFRLYCSTDQDVDHLAGQIKARGGTLVVEPRDEWGMRVFAVEDPDGFKITITKKLKR